MTLLGKPGRHLLLPLVWAMTPAFATVAQDQFAVVQIANATDDVAITYRFQWGSTGQQYIVKARQYSNHSFRYEPDNPKSYPVPEIQFASGIDRQQSTQAYALRALASPSQDRGGQWYVFEKRVNANGIESIDLVSAKAFLSHNYELLENLLATREYSEAISRCDFALGIDPHDSSTINYRGRANYLLRNYDRAVEDFAEAINRDPKQAIYRTNRGYGQVALKRYAKALADFDEAIRMDASLTSRSPRP